MARKRSDYEADLEQRLDLASKPENMGEDLNGADYVLLFLVTIAVPAVMMIVGWYL